MVEHAPSPYCRICADQCSVWTQVELTTRDIDRFLAHEATTLSTSTVARLLSILCRSIRRAQAQDLIRRNVALLFEVPRRQAGRVSKALTVDEARAVLDASEHKPIHAYVVTALLTGADRGTASPDLGTPGPRR